MFLSDFTDETLLKFSSFFHDIGKAYLKKSGKYYKNHQNKSAQVVKEITEKLSFGKKASSFCSKIVKNHLSISELFFLKKEGYLQEKDLNFWWYENKDIAPHLMLLTAADTKATLEDDNIQKEVLEFIRYLQDYYFNIYTKKIVEKPLLTGKEIMEILNLKPSKKVGIIKEHLLKAQIEGKIRTKEQAIEFIKSI